MPGKSNADALFALSVDGELQRRSEGATLCVCGPGESLRQGAKRRGVVLHEKVDALLIDSPGHTIGRLSSKSHRWLSR